MILLHSSETMDHTPNGDRQPAIIPGMATSGPVELELKQKYWSWFKDTGRGFVAVRNDGSLAFIARSQMQGKRRTIEDGSGKPLFKLERNWTSKSRAWVLKSSGDIILTVDFVPVHRRMSMTVSFDESANAQHEPVRVQASDSTGGHLTITCGDTTLATMQCKNITSGYFSSLMVVPPTWSVDVAAGADICLVC